MNSKVAMAAFVLTLAVTLSYETNISSSAVPAAHDPGVRAFRSDTGVPIAGLSKTEQAYFLAGKDEFNEPETPDEGLGPTMNLDSCGGCHSQPAVGGSSPAVNPQIAFANQMGARNRIPSFVTRDGPVREVRFVRNADGSADGGVHSLFTIHGRSDAPGCSLSQPDFEAEYSRGNAIFRIPTPVFGAGLIEQIPDKTILANQASTAPRRQQLGIGGKANIIVPFSTISGQSNHNGNDGTLARFGWKAQNKSLLIFAGEAYNVEMGISNELFPTEREENGGCQYATTPNDGTDTTASGAIDTIGATEKFALFMRFLAPPVPSTDTPGGATSISRGKALFGDIGCALCHTPSMQTGNSRVAALRNRPVNLYSDLLVHDMGVGLRDGVNQGQAGPREFRSAPLWGLGQRIFFLHDGRSSDLIDAIKQHGSQGSEANGVIAIYNNMGELQKQDLLNFLRSL
ncbi:MAG: di-heme oxidoredictase family protein [Burkholderiales bacterium]|jgi:CxxC motif-containing protein (DUF1111 family)